MAIFHFTAKVVSRGAGQSIIAKAAYNAREKLREERTGEFKDYTRASAVLFSGIFAPKDAPAWAHDRETLWNAADAAEKRKDAQTAREIEIGLPHELTDEQRRQLVTDFVREQFQRRGMVADVNIHAPGGKGDNRNYHAHILLTTREIGPEGFSAEKAREWNSRAALEGWRRDWAQLTNRYLERYGHEARIDHRTLEAQGIDRAPTAHKGPHAVGIEGRGSETERGNIHRQAFDAAQEALKLKRELAAITVEIAALERDATRQTLPERETQGTAKQHGRTARFQDAARKATGIAPPPELPENLRGTSAAIWIAYNIQAQRDPRKFAAALEENGIRLARVTKAEAEQKRREADFSNAVGNYARRYTEGELVAVNRGGDVYQLTARNTGQSREAVQSFLARGEFQHVPGVEATKEIAREEITLRTTMRQEKAEQREADWQKRRGLYSLQKWTARGGRVQQEMSAFRRIREVAAAAPRPRENDDDTRRKNNDYAERQRRDNGEIDPERYRMDPDYRRQAQNTQAYKSPEEKRRDRENDLRAMIEQQGRER